MSGIFSTHDGSTLTKAPTFASMNVREFFETQSVEATKERKRKLKQEIERKREELRVLVGERYRDLIDAADTIGTMRTGSVQVFSKLANLRSSVITLPTTLKCSSEQYNASRSLPIGNESLNEKELEIAAELKLTTSVPRQFLVCLEKEDIVGALHLYLLYKQELNPSQKIYSWDFLRGDARLSSNTGDDSTSEGLAQSLLSLCDSIIDDFSAPSEGIAECIIVKQVLGECTCEEVVKEFLSKRVKLCETALGTSTCEDFTSKVGSSVFCLNQIFIDPELYNATAKKVRKANILPGILGFMSTHVPLCLVKFNSEAIYIREPPRVSILAELILEFYIKPLKVVLANKTNTTFLDIPASLKEMENVRSIASFILKRETEDLMRIVLGSSTSVWEEVFANPFALKCQHVITIKIRQLLDTLAENMTAFHDVGINFDLVSYTWKADSSSTIELDGNGSFLDEALKLKCLTPSVVELCRTFEAHLLTLLTDFQSLVDNPLKEFISREISVGFGEIINSVHSEKETWNLFLGRFSAALSELCPTLWKLLEKNDGVAIRAMLTSVSEKCWQDWTKMLLHEFEMQLQNKIPDFSAHVVATFMPAGEVYKTEAEDSEKFEPSIRIPLQLSHALHTQLSFACLKLGQVGPQTMPKNVRDNLRFIIGESTISHYNKLIGAAGSSNGREIISPQMAVQLIFDLKFVQWFHPKLGGNVEPITTQLQALIDPFDWDICNPRLTNNLKRFLFENHLTLGLLFSEESHGFIAQNFKTKQTQSFPYSSPAMNIPLPLLPI